VKNKNMKISYSIQVCNEHEELKRLLEFLVKNIREEDEIVVQCDKGNTTPEVYEVLNLFQAPVGLKDPLKVIKFPLNRDFATFKENLRSNCTGDWIFQLDADEYPHEYLISTLPSILEENKDVDLFLIARINEVRGLTSSHINQWRWNVNDKGWVNWPDYQGRIWRNRQNIRWEKPVHEQLVGYKEHTFLPQEEDFCFYHFKGIEKQEEQNKFYNTI